MFEPILFTIIVLWLVFRKPVINWTMEREAKKELTKLQS